MSSTQLSDPVIVIGGGTWGTSTAYHLAKKGYKSVTVLDRWPVPSLESAGNDLNKVIRTDYPDTLYTTLARDSAEIWKDQNGLFAGLYSECGWIIGALDSSMRFIESATRTAKNLGVEPPQLMQKDEVRQRWPALTGTYGECKSFWSPNAAWVNAHEGVRRMANEAMKAGVKYISGDAGYVKQLLFDENGTCVGVKCADGSTNFGRNIILAAGAAAGGLLDLQGQIVAKGHSIVHIQLSPEEVETYKEIPIVNHLEGGSIFPPQEDGIMKMAAMHFVTNYAPSHPNVSLPRYRSDNPKDGIPAKIEARMRNFLKDVMPELADREWASTKICWDGDTPDNNFLITPHPTHRGLKLVLGGSGHGYKFLPVLGEYVVEMIEGTLDPAIAHNWRWRAGETGGSNSSPFTAKPEDINSFPGWAPTSTESRL